MNAQEPAASPQPKDAGRPASVVVPSDIPWDTIEWVERRYKIEAMRFKARDETGVDWWGSDEVMVGTFDAKGSTVSDEIGDIDSGDTHKFDPAKSCIIAVRPGEAVLGKTSVCDDVGEPAPLSFRVEFWEKDSQFPFGGFCVHLPGNDQHFPHHCLHYGYDDFIGQAQLVFLAHDFEAVLPNVGDEYIETVVLGGCPPGVGVCTPGWGPWGVGDYRLHVPHHAFARREGRAARGARRGDAQDRRTLRTRGYRRRTAILACAEPTPDQAGTVKGVCAPGRHAKPGPCPYGWDRQHERQKGRD